MLKQTIKFKDFNGADREETLWFNLNEAELVTMQAASKNGLEKDLDDIIKTKDVKKLLDFIKMLVHEAYGERDRDGIHFHKSPEITQNFINSAMYSPLLMSLFQDEGERSAAFITGLMPPDLVQRATEQARGGASGAQAQPESPTYQPSARERFAQAQDSKSVFDGSSEPTGFNEAPTIGLATGGGNPVMPQPTVAPDPTQDAPQTDVHPFRVPASEQDDPEFLEWKRSRAAQSEKSE